MTTPWARDESLQPLKLRVFTETLTKDEMDDMLATLTPTQELLLDVLAARERLGERLWTFDRRQAKPLAELERRGLVRVTHGIVERTVRAGLTDLARKILFHPAYDKDALVVEYGIALVENIDGQQAHRTAMWVRDYSGAAFTRQSVLEQTSGYNAVPDTNTTAVPMERRVSEWRPLTSTT